MLPITDSSSAPRLLKEARADAALTQRGLAAKSGVQQSHIAAIESGARAVSPELLTRLLRAADYRPSVPLQREADTIVRLGKENGLSQIRVFGSAVRGQDGFDSDVDLLVSVDRADVAFGLPYFISQVEDLIGFPVDVVVDDDEGIVPSIRNAAVPL